jgi:hypothetical protein
VHPVHHQHPINKPVFFAFYAVGNLYKGHEVVFDYRIQILFIPVILSKNSRFISCLPIQNDEEPENYKTRKYNSEQEVVHPTGVEPVTF